MIDKAIECISKQLEGFISRKFDDGITDPKVIVSNLVDLDGKVMVKGGKNRIVVTLIDIEETRFKAYQPTIQRERGKNQLKVSTPPVYLSLYLLVSAYFSEELTNLGLKYISAAIGFFQAKPVFDRQNTPELGATDIDKLVVEIQNQSFQDKSHMWSMLGAKYLPSILYRVRLLTVKEGAVVGTVRTVETLEEPNIS
ncbi:MAG: DUF4255 domain-containing protein [Bacteroidota bacterium]